MNAKEGSSFRDCVCSGFVAKSFLTGDMPDLPDSDIQSVAKDSTGSQTVLLDESSSTLGEDGSSPGQTTATATAATATNRRAEVGRTLFILFPIVSMPNWECRQVPSHPCDGSHMQDDRSSLSNEDEEKGISAQTSTTGEQEREKLLGKIIERKLKEQGRKRRLPNDSYSMMMIPFSGTEVAVFSLLVFLFQVGLLIIIISSFRDAPAFKPMFNPPPDVSPAVRASQFFAIIIGLLTQEDTIVSLTIFLSCFSTEEWNAFVTKFRCQEHTTRKEPVVFQRLRRCCYWSSWSCFGLCMIVAPRQMYYAANGLRLAEGLLGLLVSMIIIIQSYSVIGLFKDFAAMAFIWTLDNVAFSLASLGIFGTSLSNNANQVKAVELPEMTRRTRFVRGAILISLYAGMLSGWAYVVHQQLNGEWLPESISVQFGDSEDFAIQAYSGVYERSAKHTNSGGRFTYHEKNGDLTDNTTGHFVFCAESKRWTFITGYSWRATETFTGKIGYPCPPNPKAFSPPTDSYDLTIVPRTGWSVSNGLAMVPLSYISIFSNDCSADPECGLETSKLAHNNRTGTCDKTSSRCNCTDGFYGEVCQFFGPCKNLELLDYEADFMGFPRNYSVLKGSKFHGEPVYINYEDRDDYHLVIFAGRHWVILQRPHVLKHLKDDYFILDSYRNKSSFNGDMIQVAMRSTDLLYSVQFVSEPITGGAPNGLQWYRRVTRNPIAPALLLESIRDTLICSLDRYRHCHVENPYLIANGRCDGGDYNTQQCYWDGGDCDEFNRLYPNCNVEHPSDIGNGICDYGEYNTEQCGWDGGDCVINGYPDCHVDALSAIDNGFCDGGKYNTEQCGWDGGDCLVEGYPDCHVDHPSLIGDDICHGYEYNTEQCGWDGGDCVLEGYPDCHVDRVSAIGDLTCDEGEYNTEQCGWDGGDCVDINKYPNCTVNYAHRLGSGHCDYGEEGYNTEECGYDGGDCCQESCKPGDWGNCKGAWNHCVDPNYS